MNEQLIVFDLDETLIHSEQMSKEEIDKILLEDPKLKLNCYDNERLKLGINEF